MTNETDKNVQVNQTENADAAAKPKKKKPIMIFRPQNSRTGMVKPGSRPGVPKKPARPAGAAKPAARPAGPGSGGPDAEAIARAQEAQKAQAAAAAEQARLAAAREAAQQAKAAAEQAAREKAQAQEQAAKAAAEASAKAAEAAAKAAEAAKAATEQTAQTVRAAAETPKAEQPSAQAAPAARPAAEQPAAPAREAAAQTVRPARPAGAQTAERPRRPVSEQTRPRPVRGERREGTGAGPERGRTGVRPAAPAQRRDGTGAPRTDRRAESGQGGRTGERGSFAGRGASQNTGRGGFSRPGAAPAGRGGARPAPSDARPFDKDNRGRNDRGRNKNARGDKPDKFDRMENGRNAGRGVGKPKTGKQTKPAVKPAPKVEEKIKSIVLPDTITIRDLADKLKVAPAAIVKNLFMQGKMVTVNEEVDFDTAEEIAIEYEVICEHEVKVDVIEELLKEEPDPEETLVARPPVVCVMGHVDHGKTSLLDAIRHTHVIDREAGGITQHIGASVVMCNGQPITFLDTPGHEAFTSMRMRGANSTDIAVLVVAADDGVMPQTVEAINHAKAAGIEIIVAINKIDKPGANVEKVKQELTEYQLIPEDWGGSTIFVPLSAKTHEGIDNLLEMILLTSEVLELKANPNRRARGLIIEARLDRGRGPVATVLVQKGTLHVGDPICAGPCHGRVRAMLDDKGRPMTEAGPSTPAEIVGFSEVPGAGEILVSPSTEKEARTFAETFISEGRQKLIEETRQKMSLDDLFSQIKAGNLKELKLIVKADVQGSVEAVKQSLIKLSNDEVVVKVIHSGAGAINESDVILASASDAIIIGFNVKLDPQAKSVAEQEGVDVRLYSVIYNAIEDVEKAMKGMLDPVYEEKIIGHAQIRQTFRASGVGTIAGCYVLDGVFTRGCSARITRDGQQIFEGPVASLKRFKDDVKEVRSGYECGLVFEKFNEIAEGDEVEAFTMVEVPR